MRAIRNSRWAISFADLALLLLGFFVLLQASGSQRQDVLSGVSAQFGAKPMTAVARLRASELFVPGEAMLSPAGTARILEIGRRFAASGQGVEVTSAGQDDDTRRFDAWDLAAARLGAVARTLKMAGIREEALLIGGLDQDAANIDGQVISIRRRPLPAR